MIPEMLGPKLSFLSEEYVLIQAWKKTASYIRSHNWYADTLELDRAAVNLPDFLEDLAKQLSSPETWKNDPLRLVPAPKSQRWFVDSAGAWKPVDGVEGVAKKLRPLAHVTLKDQVAATALMLCLANRVETKQGDPCVSVKDSLDRRAVLSYGNRLFCDSFGNELHHRWGSSKLYRGYFKDYRSFLARPEVVAEEYGPNVIIVHSDLRQFYDRVRPELLAAKILGLQQAGDDAGFFEMTQRILCWEWHKNDSHEVEEYAKISKMDDFAQVALPQGLVASGFFSNIVLLEFGQGLRDEIGKEIIPGIILCDACHYVDDIRLVLKFEGTPELNHIEMAVVTWLQGLLTLHANGLVPSADKTQAAYFRGGIRPLVRQSRKMERIQHAISGGFDAIGGEEILDAVQGLVRSQERYSKDRIEKQGWAFAPIPDVRDETVARFAAARFRSTFRSLRPLLENRCDPKVAGDDDTGEDTYLSSLHTPRTRADLDDEARAFALGLIENWVEDPSNVRLLRIGLDIWPAADVLERVLELLHQYTTKGGGRKAPRRVARYCLAEIFRAGATETGFVEDSERLPDGVDITAYRAVLLEEAKKLATLPQATLPWYLKQQILLFLAANCPEEAPIALPGRNPETKPYRELIRFLKGEVKGLLDRDYAIFAVLSRRSFLSSNQAVKLVGASLTPNRAQQIAVRDPSFGLELITDNSDLAQAVSARIRHDLCLTTHSVAEGWISLADLVLSKTEMLRNELSLLRFVKALLTRWPSEGTFEVITPSDVLIKIDEFGETLEVEIRPNKLSSVGSLYKPPKWCSPKDQWRLQLGFLLRFILTTRHDFTRPIRIPHWKEGTFTYRNPDSHWYQRFYGFHSGHSAFGADWLPITDWTEQFLYALLSWPGCRPSDFSLWVNLGVAEALGRIDKRILELNDCRGEMSGILMLPLFAPCPERRISGRPLRVCVVQTVIPEPKDISSATDLSLSDPVFRKRHRNHLSAALAAVEKMLELRETHKGSDGRLDLLILPELAVHPRDVETHLVPFARTHKTIILAGMTYEEIFPGKPLINSALWLIPTWSKSKGLEVMRRRQGKQYLAPEEKRMNNPVQKVTGFRPCQWLVGYEWDLTGVNRPLWLTAAICYDATDIRLAADLRRRSDVFAIAAMNQDVNTFDHMAMALQYHMFQMVIIANNGHFGGSNAYAPYSKPYIRQVFHMHGQPQASIAFLEIDNIDEFLRRDKHALEAPSDDPGKPNSGKTWKCPPAGMCEGEVCLHKSSKP